MLLRLEFNGRSKTVSLYAAAFRRDPIRSLVMPEPMISLPADHTLVLGYDGDRLIIAFIMSICSLRFLMRKRYSGRAKRNRWAQLANG